MHRLRLLLADLLLILVATLLALVVRDNFEPSAARAEALLPYLACTLAAAAVVFPALGVGRTIWRFTAMADYLQLLVGTCVSVLAALALGFGYNRLDGVARSLPLLQVMLMLFILVGARVYMRLRHAGRGIPAQLSTPRPAAQKPETVLVVGLSRLTELYLRCIAEFAPERVHVAGLLGRSAHHTGRLVHGQKVFGTPDQIEQTLRDLEVEGVFVDRIVVTTASDRLSDLERGALLAVERSSGIKLEFVAEQLGLDFSDDRASDDPSAAPEAEEVAFVIKDAELAALARRPYWRVKRALDMFGALVLLAGLSPVMLLATLLVAIDVGFPVRFWQLRPGLGGRPFKLCKLRTMSAAHDASGRKVPESERVSFIGRFLRRVRLDELPQLLNILSGEMSFIGPRPLLRADQSAAFAARLLVRPGLTGWAQVEGGRDISTANKAALDVWYVEHASLTLDWQIFLRTLRMVFRGERTNAASIRLAWRDLQRAGICVSSDWATGQRRVAGEVSAAAGVKAA